MSQKYFFCFFLTIVVRLIYIDISTVTLKYILIYHSDVQKNSFFVKGSVSPLLLSILLYELLPYGLYILIFEKYRLQGAVWTSLDEGHGVGILKELLFFWISNENNFFVTKSLSTWLWFYNDMSTPNLSFTYIGISQFDIWWMSHFFVNE